MNELDHWHPVLLSKELRNGPVATRVAGVELVVFRDAEGKPAALIDRCAHRGMRLSCGKVQSGRLTCPYHGFRYDRGGIAECPSSPKMRPRVQALEAQEQAGAIWVRSGLVSGGAIPDLAPTGYRLVGTLRESFSVPIEPLLDNFSEVEHVPTTHAFFGYTEDSLPHITVEHRVSDDEVRTRYVGPSHRPLALRMLEAAHGNFGITTLVIEAVNRFSPLHVELNVSQQDKGGRSCGPNLKFLYFFVPTSERTTDLVGFVFWRNINLLSHHLFRRTTLAMARREVRADKSMIEQLVDTGPSMKGFTLTRFDIAVRENRRMLQKLYRRRLRESGEAASNGSSALLTIKA